MSDLYRLVYASKNFLHGSDAEIAHAVSQILAASQVNNARVGVTGALMFNAGAFAQVLEGPQSGVENTFERIQCDPRHGDVTVLQCGPVAGRGFADWSMAFVGQSAAGRARWEGLGLVSGFDLNRLDGDAVFAMLHALVLDEEGLPLVAGAAPARTADRPGSAMDVERVRAELAPFHSEPAQPVRPIQAMPDARPAAELPASAPASRGDAPVTRSEAALTVLRAALADERRLTTDLRNELDAIRIALVLEQARWEEVRRERDLWVGRARLLAGVLNQEAEAAADGAPAADARASEVSNKAAA